MKTTKNNTIFIVAGLIVSLGVFVAMANASHSWGKYHWDLSTAESTANPLKLGDNLTTADWSGSLAGASSDWNLSVLKNQVLTGSNYSCDPVLGGVEVCNDTYGTNGWLGIAQIWAYRGKDGHIAQALVKVNDTYFNTLQYDTQAWRDFVMCQEVGHTFGLDHQDENFDNANLGTCMDYTNDPDGTMYSQLDNLHPNQHDYDMMTDIYGHLNGIEDDQNPGNGKGNGKGKGKPFGVGLDVDLDNPSAWGQAVRHDAHGNYSLFERNLGNGIIVFTHVIWAN